VSTLSTHVLDIERGMPARGVPVELLLDGRSIARAVTDGDGRIPVLGQVTDAQYAIVFDVAGYFAAQGRSAPFLQRVSIEFQARGADGHYHVPLLLSPFACTTYRGS
jgi:5-hydroxyisourate hydrolase